jgi:hypothetical protein
MKSYSAAGYSTVAECPTCGTSLGPDTDVFTSPFSTAKYAFSATRAAAARRTGSDS